MTIKQDFEHMKERFEEAEIHHDNKVIAREQNDIVKDQNKEVEHENKANAEAMDGKTGFFHNMEEKVEADLVRHDEHEIDHRMGVIDKEKEKIEAHEAKIAADKKAAE